MDIRKTLELLNTLSEATKETKTGRVHTSEPGGYGRKDDEDSDGKKVKADEPKKGRGRPKKDAGEDGEKKSYDTTSLHGVFGGGEKPKKEIGKTSKKHSLKEYMESVEQSISEGTKETKTGRVHTSEPGGYGRKDDEDEKGKKVAATVKRGRGRPKKDADSDGEVKKYDWSAFGATGKDIKLPKHTGNVTKHKMVGEQSVSEASLNAGYIVKNGSKYLKGHPAGGGQMTWVADKAKATVFKSKSTISKTANMRGWSIVPAPSVSEAAPETNSDTHAGLKSWQVMIMNNYYNGKYPDYSGRIYYVVATSLEEARQVVLDNADGILQDILTKKLHNGRRVLPPGSAVPITPDRVGRIKDGTVAGRMGTAGYKKMFGPQGPMMVKLRDGAVVDVQGQEQNVTEGDDRGDYHSTARAAEQATRQAKDSAGHRRAADLHDRAATYALSAGKDSSVVDDHQMAAREHNRAAQGLTETNVAKHKELGATKDTTHFVKNVTAGKIVSPHRSLQDAKDALVALTRKSDGNEYKIVRARKDVTEAEQVTIQPAQQNTQVIKQGNDVLGSVTNPQLAAQIKSAIGKGEMTLAGDDLTEDADDLNPVESAIALRITTRHPELIRHGLDEVLAAIKEVAETAGDVEEIGTSDVSGWVKQVKDRLENQINEGDDCDVQINEKAVSKKQQKFMGMVHAAQKGEKPASPEVAKVAKTMKKSDVTDFAKTKHKGLPKKVSESVHLTEGPSTVEHIVNRFKHEVKQFLNGQEMDTDLYNALFDYYVDAGEIPYGIAKARTGDPIEWVSARFETDVQPYLAKTSMSTRNLGDEMEEGMEIGTTRNNQFSTRPDLSQVPAAQRKASGQNFPLTMKQVGDTSNKLSSLDTIRAMKDSSPFKFEGKTMKDLQVEGWNKQLTTLLKEGITVTSSTGQQGMPDSVSINATDKDAQDLLAIVRQAGLGVFGGGQEADTSDYGAPMSDTEPQGFGSDPEVSPTVVGDGDDMLALIKKMTGIEMDDGQEEMLHGNDDYEDEGDDAPCGSDDEETTEGNKFTGNLVKAREEGKKEADLDGDGDMEPVKEDDVEEGNKFTGNLAKARAQGKKEADLDGDGDMEKVREGEGEMCHECGSHGGMHESTCGHREQVEEEFQNEVKKDDGDELAKLKALLSMGNDLHKMKRDQTVLNPTQVSVQESLSDWKKLSGIK
jgi:hypothetical protein